MNLFGSVRAPPNKGGRPRSLTPIMVKALCNHLLEKPHLYLDEMAIFLWDEFQVQATTSSISRALKRERWSKKTAKYKARAKCRSTWCLCSFYIRLELIPPALFMWMNLVASKESGSEEQAGLLLVLQLLKYICRCWVHTSQYISGQVRHYLVYNCESIKWRRPRHVRQALLLSFKPENCIPCLWSATFHSITVDAEST